MLDEEMALDLLRLVIDPEIGLNIVDLGLVYEIQVEPAKVYVRMTLTTPGCPLHESISEGVRSVFSLFKDVEIDLDLVWDPPWSPEMITQEGKEALGWA